MKKQLSLQDQRRSWTLAFRIHLSPSSLQQLARGCGLSDQVTPANIRAPSLTMQVSVRLCVAQKLDNRKLERKAPEMNHVLSQPQSLSSRALLLVCRAALGLLIPRLQPLHHPQTKKAVMGFMCWLTPSSNFSEDAEQRIFLIYRVQTHDTTSMYKEIWRNDQTWLELQLSSMYLTLFLL